MRKVFMALVVVAVTLGGISGCKSNGGATSGCSCGR